MYNNLHEFFTDIWLIIDIFGLLIFLGLISLTIIVIVQGIIHDLKLDRRSP